MQFPRYLLHCSVESVREVAAGIFVLRFESKEIAGATRPGQFVNIKVNASYEPLLRRPFSVFNVDGSAVEIVFNIVGKGTLVLSKKKQGELLDVLGPLGIPFTVDDGFETALLVGGGLGVAPLPLLTRTMGAHRKEVMTFIGARSSKYIVKDYLMNVLIATDDGSDGFHGTVVDCFIHEIQKQNPKKPKIFGCGPTPMLTKLSREAAERRIPCEVSLEGAMACGFGICQGCPVEVSEWGRTNMLAGRAFSLICKEGPVYDSRSVLLG